MAYPVTFNIERPTGEFDKAQIVLRIVLLLFLGWIGQVVGWVAYLGLPILAAVMISQKGAQEYLANAEENTVRWLRYIMGFYSYVALASDELSFGHPENVDLKVQPTGQPTVGSALLRIIMVIPHAIVLAVLGFIFGIVWIISVISILISGTYPDWAFHYIRGYLRWTARVLAYMASLVDKYPPFSFGGDDSSGVPAEQISSPPDAPATKE